ncbi:MAG: response regulator [Mariniphaga sp.]
MFEIKFSDANILIVDDKEANIDVLVGLFEMQGYTNIRTTLDPREVVSIFKSFNPDLILLDLMMPHLSGHEVMIQLKELIPADTYLPILVLTADISADSKKRALAGGANDFLAKPFDLIEMSLRINNLLFARYLYKQLQNQNQFLDQKVKERTAELEKTNRALLVALNKAEENDRLKTAFLNNISHEIRTPFNGILGFLSILQHEDLSDPERDEYISVINQSSIRLMSTINDIVEISQIQTNQVRLVSYMTNLRDLGEELFNRFNSQAINKGLKLIIHSHLPKSIDSAYTDGKKLNNILSCLIDNAIKFTKVGSIDLDIFKVDDFLKFSVKDTGIGIPKNKHYEIYQRFMQIDGSNTRQFEGSGLGLSIAKAHIEMLGGTIWLESEEGEGSTFHFTIPLIPVPDEKNLVSVKIPDRSTGHQGRNLKILIAEDNEISGILISLVVRKFGQDVIIAKTGIEAVEACRMNPDIDLILMDIKMPEMDGHEATRQIRQFNSDVVIIAQTAYALPGDREMAIAAGCNDYISKPIMQALLNALMEKYFNKP